MTVVELDTELVAAAAARLRFVGDLLERTRLDVIAASRLARLAPEHEPAIDLVDELRDELGSTARLLALSADRAAAADASITRMIDGWIDGLASALRSAINDRHGATVSSLLWSDDPARWEPALVRSLTPASAAARFGALTPAAQMALVASSERTLEGTPFAPAIADWKDGLDHAGVRELYTRRAFDRARVDPDAWRPTLGLEHNRVIVESVYEYYGELYRLDGDRLWWAGMAALIGPSFYGGFQDLGTFGALLHAAGRIADGPLGAALPHGVAAATRLGGDRLADELRWYQVRLLSMQREIFCDMAPAHEAYLDGGVDMIERMYEVDAYGFGAETTEAWRLIDTGWRIGDAALVATGNATLLRREQERVIRDDYDRMRARPVTGTAVTWAMTAVGAPSVPGARPYAEVFPATIDLSPVVGTPSRLDVPLVGSFPLPHVEVEAGVDVETPLPGGNISVFEDRWALIEADTLPAYVLLAEHHPEVVLDALRTPIRDRAARSTFVDRLDRLVLDAVTNWSVHPELAVELGW